MRKLLLFIAFALSSLCASAEIQLQEAVDFLYRYMTPADKANHSEAFFREQARYALAARNDMPWQVPDSLWRHFVLPPRVNNEELDSFRMQKYSELRDRVKGLSMRDAALEVNHWCHEYVIYRPSDQRTVSPLATLKTGSGRCGEESVLAVAAMRTVGIPARQVYTPCWAHTDDNHAWIEVWVDGKWHFMGACEPEPVLNMGWFNASAARAMLMHTNVFGDWHGPEDVVQRNECFTEINCIANYVPTRVNNILVVDTDGRPVADAMVEYQIYNYGYFCTVAVVRTDANGRTSLTTGLGDMLVWANKDGRFGYAKMSGGDVRVVLSHVEGDELCDDIDIVPPPEGMIPIEVTDEQIAANKLRLDREVALRQSRLDRSEQERLEECLRLGCNDLENFLMTKSETNFPEISRVLTDTTVSRRLAALMLYNLTEKDLRDVTAATLLSYLRRAPECRVDSALYCPYVLSPRIEMEPLRPFVVPERMRSMAPEQILAWTHDSIRIVSNPLGLRFTPQAVYDSRQADAISRDIFFIALCRANGIPACIDGVSGRTVCFVNDSWLTVDFGEQQTSVSETLTGDLQLAFTPTDRLPDLDYYRHFTISKIENGVACLLNYEGGETTESGSTMTALHFRDGQPMAEGYYMLVTGTRMSSGKVLAHIGSFKVMNEWLTTMPIFLREGAPEDITVKGYFNADPLLPQTGRGYFLLMLAGRHDEPTNHARAELSAAQPFLEQWGRPVVILDAEENAPLVTELREAVNSPQRTLPIVVIADSFGRILYYSEGYNTSLATHLRTTIPNL